MYRFSVNISTDTQSSQTYSEVLHKFWRCEKAWSW